MSRVVIRQKSTRKYVSATGQRVGLHRDLQFARVFRNASSVKSSNAWMERVAEDDWEIVEVEIVVRP